MSIRFLLIVFNLFFVLNTNIGGKITDSLSKISEEDQLMQEPNKSNDNIQPILLDSTSDHIEEELNEAINDNEDRLIHLENAHADKTDEQKLTDMTHGLLEQELQEATKDDAHVPSSLDNSVFDESDIDNFEFLSLSTSSISDINQQMKYFTLDKVASGNIPPGIIIQDYSPSDRRKLIRLYQSTKVEDTKELFQYIAEHIHNKYINCLANLGRWIKNPQSDEPVFYRNCVPCTNAVDLNLQNLFDQQIQTDKLKHYFVNTCNMEKQWISYISDMESISMNLKRHPTMTFTDVIRQSLIPNHRYVIQGIVKSTRRKYHKGFFHVCNMISDEYGHIWIIDGQVERIFDLNQSDDVKELDEIYHPDYIARASTGLFRPPSLPL